ncbi:LVIVD repeat-containing protein [Streptosporangium sp. DT93]
MPVGWAVAVAVAVAVPASTATARADDIPAPGKVVTSANVRHLGTLPKLPGLEATTNSDIAFQGDYAYVGNYGGFSIYDIGNPARARLVSGVLCPGYQMDVAVHGDLLFTDELGGGAASTCNEATGPNQGADAVHEIVKGRLVLRSYFKIPRRQAYAENCVAHNGSLIPVRGRDLMVQAWCQGGVSFVDFTDPVRPREFGHFERGPEPDGGRGGIWSAYYCNGHVYASDYRRGLDVLRIDDPRTDPAERVRMDRLNAQTQSSFPERRR